jgi:multiple sugar transport system permease protein
MARVFSTGQTGFRPTPRTTNNILLVGTTLIATLLILLPVFWMVNAAVRPIAEILTYPPAIVPKEVTLRFFGNILGNEQYRRYYLNSIILASATTVFVMPLGLVAAYGFSRFRMPAGRVMLMGIMALLLLPPVTLILPYFKLFHDLKLYDTLTGLVLVNMAWILPISIWLLKGYLDAIPVELEQAAMIDGATRLQALRMILVPILVPSLIGIGTYVFIQAWNEYLLAVTLTDSPSSQPLTIGLGAFFGQFTRDWNSIMALSTLASLPLVVLFVLFQRWVVQGMTSGAIK